PAPAPSLLYTLSLHDALPISAVYQASAAGLDPLRARGFVAYHIGLEAMLDLNSFDLSGPRRANLRHTVTRAQRGGLRFEWYPTGDRKSTRLNSSHVSISYAVF